MLPEFIYYAGVGIVSLAVVAVCIINYRPLPRAILYAAPTIAVYGVIWFIMAACTYVVVGMIGIESDIANQIAFWLGFGIVLTLVVLQHRMLAGDRASGLPAASPNRDRKANAFSKPFVR